MAAQQAQPAATNQAGNQPSLFERMLMQMMMGQKMNASERAGASLGNILMALLKNWKNNYDMRGAKRSKYEPLTPEERAQELDRIQQQSPQEAAADRQFMQERGFEIAQPQQQAQPQATAQPQTTPQISAPISQAGQQIMPSTDFQQQQGLLGTAEDWEETMRKYLAPFNNGGWGVR